MKLSLVLAALLLGSSASALSTAQREQHLREIFAAASISAVPCPPPATTSERLCGQIMLSDALIERSWEVYSAYPEKVSVTARQNSGWDLNREGTAYTSRFTTSDDDTYVVSVTRGLFGTNSVTATWSKAAAAAKPATAPVAAAPAAPASPVPDLSRPKAECDPGALSVNNISGTSWVSATWYQDAVFPTPAQRFTRGVSDGDYTQSCPNFDAAFDSRKGEFTFRGKTFDDVLNYGGLGRYTNSPSISLIDHSGFLQIAQIGLTYDRSTKTFKTVGDNTADFNLTAMGYRVDGGALMPLYFQGKISAMVVPAGANVLEVYAQPSQYTGWQYLKVDIAAGALTAQRTYPFPAK